MVKEILGFGLPCVIFSFDETAVLCGRNGRGESILRNLLDAPTVFEGNVLGIFLNTANKMRDFSFSDSHSLAGCRQ